MDPRRLAIRPPYTQNYVFLAAWCTATLLGSGRGSTRLTIGRSEWSRIMGSRRLGRSVRLAVVLGTAVTFACSCSTASTQATGSATTNSATTNSGTAFGPSQPLGNGTVKTYVTLDDAGQPTEVGLRLTPAAMDGLPQDTGPAQMVMLAFPDQAGKTAFNHVMLNWNPQGHDPVELFGKPHFDFHFDMVDMATMQAINPDDPKFAAKAEHLPEPRYVPQNYVVPPGPPLVAQVVPGMGVHLVDSSDATLVPGKYDFKQIIISGVWDGRYTFIEPMITREWLLTQPTLQGSLKQPQAYQKSAFYPSTYSVHVDPQTKDYVIALTGLTMHQAS
jgi:Domain of unknown function (DUF5602)